MMVAFRITYLQIYHLYIDDLTGQDKAQGLIMFEMRITNEANLRTFSTEIEGENDILESQQVEKLTSRKWEKLFPRNGLSS